MGSCISKCKPKKTPKKERHQQEAKQPQCIDKINNIPKVEDKLVISQAPIPSPPKKPLVSPISPPNVPSSPSSSCTNSNYYPTTSSSSSTCSFLSSTSSTSSSVVSSELDRSVDNPLIIHRDYPIKGANSKTRSSLHTRCNVSGNKINGPRQQPPSPQRAVAQKRPRCSSPSNLTRQKSFRRETERSIVSSTAHQKSLRREPERSLSRSSRDLRPISPSPSRRFKGEAMTTSSLRKDNGYVRPHSPSSINSRRYGGGPKNLVPKKDNQGINGIGSKLEELALGGALVVAQDMDWMLVEDANNPHIALDCFIFL